MPRRPTYACSTSSGEPGNLSHFLPLYQGRQAKYLWLWLFLGPPEKDSEEVHALIWLFSRKEELFRMDLLPLVLVYDIVNALLPRCLGM
ncbi:MAG: hypothetical protein NZ949_07355 [Candidatus Kapabacteria bacterium]|nr:hypothetical protein [Candidatus Kapabacteria bacterium]